mmetsp:Transcript_38130/g.89381  ORF Transcript_38130/g.89381 Transcript_38130/m.89381 type:complete len:299 (+) Transcript_38130:155-1051(+)
MQRVASLGRQVALAWLAAALCAQALHAGRAAQAPAAAPVGPSSISAGQSPISVAAAKAQELGVAASAARSETSGLRAILANSQAENGVEDASKAAASLQGVEPQVVAMELGANQSLARATAAEAKLEALLHAVPHRAAAAAAQAAQQEVEKLSAEANAYFQKLDAAATPHFAVTQDVGDKLVAAAEARKPYDAAKNRISEIAHRYNEAAGTLASQTQELVSQAFEAANRAVDMQKSGSEQAAKAGMSQAWQLMREARIKKHEARAARRFAESVNAVVPSYVKASQMAAENVLGSAVSR